MKFLITGGTGLIGKSIVQLLIEKNHHINVLSRKRGEDTKQVRYYQWSPKNQTIDFTCIDDVDVIINLAGENIFGLWTKSKKKKILESRVKSLQLLKKLIKNRPNNVKQIISASAIGIFPNSQEIIFDENSTQKGNTFLANVVKEWEREIESLKAFKINVTTVRIGMVFCELGGIIKVLRLISKSRFLSFIGNGDQKISWIHLNDLTELFYKISQKNYNGLIHAVNNNPTTMLDLITNLTNKYKLKFKLFIPGLILKSFFRLLCLGDFYEDIANSNKNVVSKLINKVHPNLKYTSLKDL